ncbi:MAG TPA: CvpA family protein, partial [Gammaproteobacteria bacterium]|nr:CvpA family protein [Gammaproteobacteria bacterium]
MVWVDYLIPGIIVVSALLSLMRGFVREAMSLTGWLLAA